jgi:hypothetical protein
VGNDPLNATDPSGKFLFLVTGGVGAVGGFPGDLTYQFVANGGSFQNLNWGEARTAGAFGFAAGAAAPFVATSTVGASALGAVANVAQYVYTQGSNSTLPGTAFAAGAVAVAGPISNPFMFIDKISPFSGSAAAAAANSGGTAFARSIAGGVASSINIPSADASEAPISGQYGGVSGVTGPANPPTGPGK